MAEERRTTLELKAVHDSIEWVQSNLQILSPQQLIQELEIIKMWVKNKLTESKIENDKSIGIIIPLLKSTVKI